MKRTGEVTLGVIGVVFSALTSLFGMLFLFMGSDAVKNEIVNDPTMANDPNLSVDEMLSFLDIFAGFGWAVIIATIIGLILGIIGIIKIIGNKNPKLAGWMYISGAILMGVISLGVAFLPAILLLVAGIMCFVRKAPVETTIDPQTF